MDDAYGTARLAAKDTESAIVARICEDFNLTPVLARAHYEQVARYFAEYGHMALRPGELCYLAVASKSLRASRSSPAARCRWPRSSLHQRTSRACSTRRRPLRAAPALPSPLAARTAARPRRALGPGLSGTRCLSCSAPSE